MISIPANLISYHADVVGDVGLLICDRVRTMWAFDKGTDIPPHFQQSNIPTALRYITFFDLVNVPQCPNSVVPCRTLRQSDSQM